MKTFAVLTVVTLMLGITPMLLAANLWYDGFDDGVVNAAYFATSGGNGVGDPEWVEEDGVIKQIQPKPGDPTLLCCRVV